MEMMVEGNGGNRASGAACVTITMVSTTIFYINSYKGGCNVSRGMALENLSRCYCSQVQIEDAALR